MPRHATPLRYLSEKDMYAFRLLWNCHHVARSTLPITDSRLKAYEKLGLIDRCRDMDNREIIRRSSKGKAYLSRLPEFSNRKAYHGYTASAHNCKLAEVFSALPQEEQLRWCTELEVADLYRASMAELRETDYGRWRELVDKPWSPTDGAIINDNGEVETLIEVTSNYYKGVEEKETCAAVIQAPVAYYKS